MEKLTVGVRVVYHKGEPDEARGQITDMGPGDGFCRVLVDGEDHDKITQNIDLSREDQ